MFDGDYENDEKNVELENVRCLSASKKALNCYSPVLNKGKAFWIPLSLVHPESEVMDVGNSGTLIVPEWFAVKEGLV